MKKSNFADVLVLLLKAQILDKGVRQIRLDRATVERAEKFDMKMERSKLAGGEVILTLVEAPDTDDAKIIVPHGDANPLRRISRKR